MNSAQERRTRESGDEGGLCCARCLRTNSVYDGEPPSTNSKSEWLMKPSAGITEY